MTRRSRSRATPLFHRPGRRLNVPLQMCLTAKSRDTSAPPPKITHADPPKLQAREPRRNAIPRKTTPKSQAAMRCTIVGFGDPFQKNSSTERVLISGSGHTYYVPLLFTNIVNEIRIRSTGSMLHLFMSSNLTKSGQCKQSPVQVWNAITDFTYAAALDVSR